MKFAEIIRNAGLNPESFKKSANLEINLYDGKDRLSSEEKVEFIETFFKKNEGALKNFQNFVTGLENETIKSMNVKVDSDCVILFYKTPRAIVFLRNPSMDPLDYME